MSIEAEAIVEEAITSGLLRPGLRVWALAQGVAVLKATLRQVAAERRLSLPRSLDEVGDSPDPEALVAFSGVVPGIDLTPSERQIMVRGGVRAEDYVARKRVRFAQRHGEDVLEAFLSLTDKPIERQGPGAKNPGWFGTPGGGVSDGTFTLNPPLVRSVPGQPPGQSIPSSASLKRLHDIARSVNPSDSTTNCLAVSDAVIERLRDPTSTARAPPGRSGHLGVTTPGHYGTQVEPVRSFDAAFDKMRKAPDGTVGVIVIVPRRPRNQGGHGADMSPEDRSRKNGHVVVITKQQGTVAIIEGQDWPRAKRGVIISPAEAQERYDPDHECQIGLGVLPKKS